MQRLGKPRRRYVGSHALTKAAVVMALLATAGCGMQPYDPPNYREDPPGPGALSGKSGEFVIYRKQEPADEANTGEAPADQQEGSDPDH